MRAWFRKGGGKDDVIPEEEEMLAGPHNVGIPTGYGYDPTPPLPPGQYWYDPRRPMQYPAPRVEELYISEQERDLYLAALTSLETPTPNLVLCNSPAPQLPLVVPSTPLVTPKIEYPTTPQPPEHGSARPTPRTATRHAILTLVGDAGLRFTGFPGNAVVAATEAVRAAWAFGVSGRSGDIADIDGQEPIVYRLELKGKAWNRKSTKELESIRLLLAIFTALGKFGWKVGGPMASMGKNDTHNLLFRKVHAEDVPPPLYFALSLPVPDRLSLISPPESATEALIETVRACILETASDIKLENWLHPGVYRFWVAGMRGRLLGLKNEARNKVLPPLMVNVMDSLAALHFEWITSVPIEPSGPGREILIFSSTPESGLGAKDAYVPVSHTVAAAREIPIETEEAAPAVPSKTITPGVTPMSTHPPSLRDLFLPREAQDRLAQDRQAQDRVAKERLGQPAFPSTLPAPTLQHRASNPLPSWKAPMIPPPPKRSASLDADDVRRLEAGEVLPRPAADYGPRPVEYEGLGAEYYNSPQNYNNYNNYNRPSSEYYTPRTSNEYNDRPQRNPARGVPVPLTRPVSGVPGSMPVRPAISWDPILHSSTPGRYPRVNTGEIMPAPTSMPMAMPAPILHNGNGNAVRPSFPTNPGFPQAERRYTPPQTPPKEYPKEPHASAALAPTRSTGLVHSHSRSKSERVSSFIPLEERRTVGPRASVDSAMSAMSDDPRLVTPTIAPSTLLPKGFPWVTPDKQESLELDHEDAAGPASLPPPPRRIPSREDTRAVTVAADTPKASPNGKSITAGKKQRPISALPEPTKKERPVSALPELSPLPVTPLMPAPRMRDEIHNVRLGAAFDDARNMRLSIASEFSVSTVGSASTKAGSSRARITRTTVKAP